MEKLTNQQAGLLNACSIFNHRTGPALRKEIQYFADNGRQFDGAPELLALRPEICAEIRVLLNNGLLDETPQGAKKAGRLEITAAGIAAMDSYFAEMAAGKINLHDGGRGARTQI